MIGVELLEGVYTLQRARCRRQHLLGSQGQRADFCAGANERDGKRQLAELQHFEDFFETGVVDGAVQDHVVAAGRPAGPRWRPRRIAPGPGVGQCGGRGLRRRGAQGLALRRRVARPRLGVLRHRRWRAIAAAAIGLREQFGERADRRAGRRFRRVRRKHDHRERSARVVDQRFQRIGALGPGAEVPGSDHPAGLDRDGPHFPVRVGESHGEELAAEAEHREDFSERKCLEGAPEEWGHRRRLPVSGGHEMRPNSILMLDALAPIFMLVARTR